MGRRLRRRPPANHAQRAEWMRTHPFEWLEVSTYPATYSAHVTARAIRTGDRVEMARHYGPAGAFETRTTTTEGGTTVHARFIGKAVNG
ncbi:hypothetical protein GTX53_24190 [Streptomyces sp. SID5594]|uniref:hypothetical protein n=1 Tax=unclassified Streptomyces TaxID=2593676 RepID=UPI00037D1E99|nr:MULTISPECIES: hypothetical protein [unclassified Streptomyces]MZF56892.1 hypothetical protein [Streptomyces sp. SID5594]